MNKKELIKYFEELPYVSITQMGKKSFIDLIEQLDEPEIGSADEAPRYVKNILARLRELPLHDREVWLKAIMGEFERDKVTIPQFVADWLKKNDWREDTSGEQSVFDVFDNLTNDSKNGYYKDVKRWIDENGDLFARAWLDGYTIQEKQYRVKMKAIKSNSQYLVFGQLSETWWFGSAEQIGHVKSKHTRKEIEDAGFGEVFNSPLFEVVEVEE